MHYAIVDGDPLVEHAEVGRDDIARRQVGAKGGWREPSLFSSALK